ncbi:PspC domain-containing protein [Sutcliffiella deserti]|uniref:PspC domain-containing protein n=1 Tax=Sutcliffiella deserti TaxID=2875501 RepID=UPI001CBCD329|nr:PspC domain-containing protein [Sutcliffiella deserti]
MKKLYKSTQDRQLSGVIGGLSEMFKIDVSLLRILTALSFFFTGGIVLWIYIIAAFVLPTDKQLSK